MLSGMMKGKAALLARITSRVPGFKSVPLGQEISGSSPPSVFVGRFGYPKVSVGPLLPPIGGDTRLYDSPEEWIPLGMTTEEVFAKRVQLVRGKKEVSVHEPGKIADMAVEIALAARSPEVEASFAGVPRGSFLHEEVQPFGPSAQIRELKVYGTKWDNRLEKAYNDTDLLAKDAMIGLFNRGQPLSDIMRALSVGALGIGRNRKLVPTRWSITAVDSNLSAHLLGDVKEFGMLEEYRVYEFESFNNRYLIMLYPSMWQYEWIEAFFPNSPGDFLSIFGDWETFEGKKEYSRVGGCYYSAKLAVLERLHAEKKQAGVLILREAYSNYIPLGVWNCRENIRNAMQTKPVLFETFNSALEHMFSRLRLPKATWRANSKTMRERNRQTSLASYARL
jgi:hypothetical protein